MTAITVTAEHIAAGVPDNCEQDPIALAIRDALLHITSVAVGPDTCTIETPDGKLTDVELPQSAQDAVCDIDNGVPIEPFTFDLDYPATTRSRAA